MDENQYIKRISHEEFKKLDINTISYIQLYNGEILMLDHPYMHSNQNDIKTKTNKELKNNNDYNQSEANLTLPKEYFGQNNRIYRANSVKNENKGRILFNEEWREIQDYDPTERMIFYDNIPKRAKFWERESYDPTRSLFQSKRLEKMENYNYHQNITNYNPIRQDSFSSSDEEEKEKHENADNNNKNQYDNNNSNQYDNTNQYENNNYNNYNYNNADYNNENYNTDTYNNNNYNNSYEDQINQIFSNQKDLYNLVFGPQLSQYILGEQSKYQSGQYDQEYYPNNSDQNYYQAQTNDDYYNYNYNQNDFYQNNYDYYQPILNYDDENDDNNKEE